MISPPILISSDFVGTITQGVQDRSHGRVRNLSIELDGEVVFLRGQAASYHTKQLAQHGALDVIADRQLINEIIVV